MTAWLPRLIASGAGAGYAPKAPGTVGSLAALLLGAAAMTGPRWLLPLLAAAAALAGLAAIPRAGVAPGADPGWVVIDEVAGQCIALLGLGGALTWPGLLVAFALFRLFDIAKPGPIGWADRQPGAFGIMADDILAGVAAALMLAGARWAGWLA